VRASWALVATAVAVGLVHVPAPAAALPARSETRPAVLEVDVIGKSVAGRRIRAWHLGQRQEEFGEDIPTVVLISTMHGNERATQQILESLRDGAPVYEVDLWVVPVYNPDGLARNTRKNARGVDLNRNYPYDWADLDGNYESGPRPASEPETRATMKFLTKVRPDYILSFHQPLHGVDINVKRPKFARKVARHLDLPTTNLDCGGVCHGTMTGWFNHRFPGFALTVEYGAKPGRKRMREVAPPQVLAIFDAFRSATAPDQQLVERATAR
jgi:murein peptide amidase A